MVRSPNAKSCVVPAFCRSTPILELVEKKESSNGSEPSGGIISIVILLDFVAPEPVMVT